MNRLVASLCISLALAGCSNGAQTSLPRNAAAPDAAAAHQRHVGKLSVRIRIPRERHPSRGPRYISAATKGMTIAFAGASPFVQTIDLTPADPRCSGTPLICTIVIDAPAGRYTAALSAYDAAPVSGAIPETAHVLSTAKNIALSLKPGIVNTLAVTLDGVPYSVTLSNLPTANAGTAFAATPFTVTANDAGGETIVGAYATPLVLSDSDTTGATTLATSGTDHPAPSTLLSSSDAATIAYGGQTIAGPTIGITGAPHATPVSYTVNLPVYVANTGDNAIEEIPAGCFASTCVTTTPIGGGWSNPYGVAVDKFGNVFAANENLAYVGEIFPPCSSGTCVTKLGAGFDEVYAVAVDSSENVYVADTGHGLVKELFPTCQNDASCVTTLPGTYGQPKGIAVDTHGNVFVTDTTHGNVDEIPSTCRGADPGCVIVRATGFLSPWGIAVDAGDDVFVTDSAEPAVYVLPPGCGTPVCAGQIAGTFSKPAGISVDSNGFVYIADAGSQTITKSGTGCITPCSVTLGGGFNQPWGVAVQRL